MGISENKAKYRSNIFGAYPWSWELRDGKRKGVDEIRGDEDWMPNSLKS
jgi:hypothetical protein